jgi:capsule polysaccharide modification protein KpsS
MIKTSSKISYPVTLTEVKTALGLDASDGNASEITLAYQGATQDIEYQIQKDIALTDNSINEFHYSGQYYTVYEANLVTVQGVYVNDVSVTFEIYNIEDGQFTIKLGNSISDRKLTIQYRSGYEENKCPLNMKNWILRVTKDIYDIENTSYLENGIKENSSLQYRLIRAFRKINI